MEENSKDDDEVQSGPDYTPPSDIRQPEFDVTRRVHNLLVTTIFNILATINNNSRVLLDDRFEGELRFLMIEVGDPTAEIRLWIDQQPYITTVQQLIDAGLDERVSESFYLTKIDLINNRFTVLFNPQRPTKVKDRVYWEVVNRLPALPLTVYRYQYNYYADKEFAD